MKDTIKIALLAIIGMMKMPRSTPRSGKRSWKTTAASVPNSSGRITASTV